MKHSSVFICLPFVRRPIGSIFGTFNCMITVDRFDYQFVFLSHTSYLRTPMESRYPFRTEIGLSFDYSKASRWQWSPVDSFLLVALSNERDLWEGRASKGALHEITNTYFSSIAERESKAKFPRSTRRDAHNNVRWWFRIYVVTTDQLFNLFAPNSFLTLHSSPLNKSITFSYLTRSFWYFFTPKQWSPIAICNQRWIHYRTSLSAVDIRKVLLHCKAMSSSFVKECLFLDTNSSGYGSNLSKNGHSRTCLIVNYLPQSVKEQQFRQMFAQIGRLRYCRLM